MPTVPELKKELKALGVHGYSKKRKCELEAMVATAKSKPIVELNASIKGLDAAIKRKPAVKATPAVKKIETPTENPVKAVEKKMVEEIKAPKRPVIVMPIIRRKVDAVLDKVEKKLEENVEDSGDDGRIYPDDILRIIDVVKTGKPLKMYGYSLYGGQGSSTDLFVRIVNAVADAIKPDALDIDMDDFDNDRVSEKKWKQTIETLFPDNDYDESSFIPDDYTQYTIKANDMSATEKKQVIIALEVLLEKLRKMYSAYYIYSDFT